MARRDSLLAVLPPEARARLLSCGGQHAGAWLCCMPVIWRLRALPHLFYLALAMRLGVSILDLQPVRGVYPVCGACGAVHDELGRHPSVCRHGNRSSLWTDRHDALQWAIIWALRRARYAAARAVGRTRLFGSAGVTTTGGYLFADLWVPNYRAPGRHLFADVAITDPAVTTALSASPSSAHSAGVAAQLRAQRKRAKYGDAVTAVSGEFIAAVMERYGACSDDLCRLAAIACGDGDRELSEADDWYFTAPSRRSYFMQGVVFAGVMADAAMLDSAIALDHSDCGVRGG